MILFNSDFSTALEFGIAVNPASIAFSNSPALKCMSALK